MTNYIYIATSLDGFIAKKNGGLDWLNEIPNPDKNDFGFNAFMNNIDALVMGRNTYEIVLSFNAWPYNKKVFVLSNTLTEIDSSLTGKAEVIKGEPKDIVNKLNQQGYKNLYIDGGKVIQTFLKEDLIDELIITRVPILLGEGILLFGNDGKELKLEHCSTETFENGLVKSHYKRTIS